MKIILAFLISLPSFVLGQITPEQFGGDIQKAIDSAIKTNGTVYLKGIYTISKPLVAAKWDGQDYQPFSIKIIGDATMWDINAVSMVKATFKDAPVLSIHRGKGVIVRGVNFQGIYKSPHLSEKDFYNSNFETYGDKTCRDTRYSPYAGIAIDPFRSSVPPDGGYPTLTAYYRGKKSQGGSTGCRIEDCTFNNFTIGIIVSPNGETANAELMTFQNIRFYNLKACIVGCQDQEKSNRIINAACWGRAHTFLDFGHYGKGSPGFYILDGIQLAGGIVRFVHRVSGGYFPLYASNVFAESIGEIGVWKTEVGDRLSNSTFSFIYPENRGNFPDGQLQGKGVTVENCNLRYYGRQDYPILLNGEYNLKNVATDMPPIYGLRGTQSKPGYVLKNINPDGHPIEIQEGVGKLKTQTPGIAKGNTVCFMNIGSWDFMGIGIVDSVSSGYITIKFISPSIKNGVYGICLYSLKS